MSNDNHREGSVHRDGEAEGPDARRVVEMLRAYRAAETDMLTRARRALSMSENEFHAVRFLLQQPEEAARPQALIRHLGISSASVTTMVDKLERAGRVQRRAIEGDRRAVAISATAQVREEMHAMVGEVDHVMETAAQQLTPSELQTVGRFLRAMSAAVGEIAAV